MIYLVQRIIVNSYGWTMPSPGRLGPRGEGEYVRQNGFGHEDWNFNLDLAIRDHLYGYAYYKPSDEKSCEQFQIAFATYANHHWRLVGFYLDAEFVSDPVPVNRRVLKAKAAHLRALKSANSLGKPWTSLDTAHLVEKLQGEAQWLRWKVHISKALRLPQPVPIPKRLFNSRNFRITKPTEVDVRVFKALRSLASRTALSDEDDEAAFPEGREVLLQHRARERSPAVVSAAKSRFLNKHGRFMCQVCGFDFEAFYGELGKGFIEAHHTKPVSDLPLGAKTKVADIALVCSNCHRMLHRRRPWLAMADLKALLRPGNIGS